MPFIGNHFSVPEGVGEGPNLADRRLARSAVSSSFADCSSRWLGVTSPAPITRWMCVFAFCRPPRLPRLCRRYPTSLKINCPASGLDLALGGRAAGFTPSPSSTVTLRPAIGTHGSARALNEAPRQTHTRASAIHSPRAVLEVLIWPWWTSDSFSRNR